MMIQKLEGSRITGVVPNPKTTAACTANVRKVFSILKSHPQMTTELLFDSERTLSGDRVFLLKLLRVVKNIYKHQRSRSKSLRK